MNSQTKHAIAGILFLSLTLYNFTEGYKPIGWVSLGIFILFLMED